MTGFEDCPGFGESCPASCYCTKAPDPYCPEHGTEPTTYDDCSCAARARMGTSPLTSVEQRLIRIGMRQGLTESARAMLNLCITEVRRG